MPYRIVCLLFGLLLSNVVLQAQPALAFWEPAPEPNPKRLKSSSWIIGGGYGLSMVALGSMWYAQEDLGRFHFFDDSFEWKQMDKAGHLLGGYTGSRWMYGVYRWAGMPKRKALVVSGVGGFLAMSSIEVMDGFGESWGFSWWDVGANFLGSSLMVLNQGLWDENRIQLKASYRRSPYATDPRYDHLFGSTWPEWLLKDYNGLAVWASVRVHSFLPESNFKDLYPRWLNFAVGYGAEGLIGQYRLDQDPDQLWKTREYRQLYLSLDLDLTQIQTRSPFLRSLFGAVNVLRIPFPSVQFDRTGVAFQAFR